MNRAAEILSDTAAKKRKRGMIAGGFVAAMVCGILFISRVVPWIESRSIGPEITPETSTQSTEQSSVEDRLSILEARLNSDTPEFVTPKEFKIESQYLRDSITGIRQQMSIGQRVEVDLQAGSESGLTQQQKDWIAYEIKCATGVYGSKKDSDCSDQVNVNTRSIKRNTQRIGQMLSGTPASKVE